MSLPISFFKLWTSEEFKKTKYSSDVFISRSPFGVLTSTLPNLQILLIKSLQFSQAFSKFSKVITSLPKFKASQNSLTKFPKFSSFLYILKSKNLGLFASICSSLSSSEISFINSSTKTLSLEKIAIIFLK